MSQKTKKIPTPSNIPFYNLHLPVLHFTLVFWGGLQSVDEKRCARPAMVRANHTEQFSNYNRRILVFAEIGTESTADV
jgi:hypothetical protein